MLTAPKKILIADDEEAILTLVSMVLEDHGGYDIILAHDGTEALALTDRENPDLVVLDVNMPGPDGIEVCTRIKRNVAHATTKVIMLTAMAQDSFRHMALRLGTDDYLTKPFSVFAFEEKVRTYLNTSAYARIAPGSAPIS